MQELDGDVAGILRDLVEFLECLGEVEMPEGLQVAREALLRRSRSALEQPSGPDSPEPYLDMKAGKSLMLLNGDDDQQPQEYVHTDNQVQRGSLHYYETFQDFQHKAGKAEVKTEAEKDMENVILLYASFSAAQAKEKAVKSGPLVHLRRERKMFAPFSVFGSTWMDRQCWASLVGTHLLLYANERDSRPYLTVPLRGYKSRAAPSALPKDSRRSDAAFEVYCPGDITFQFVARNAQEMRDWVNAVTESLEPEACGSGKGRTQTFVDLLDLESNERMCIERVKEEQEKYQDVLQSPKVKTKEKQPVVKAASSEKEKVEKAESKDEEPAPPLPARAALRKLPSIPPSQDRVSFGNSKEEPYEEEGLYHRIEDIKAQREYQNYRFELSQSSQNKNDVSSVDLVQNTYDDVNAIEEKSKAEEPAETYDDIGSLVQNANNNEPISYDDVQNVAESLRAKAEKDKTPKPSKPLSKLFNFDRVLNRRESVKKDDKKPKSPTIIHISSPTKVESTNNLLNPEPELPCYDDVANLTNQENGTEEENYLTPPPPRPIYSRPPTIIRCAVPSSDEEIYDDIGSGTEVNGNNDNAGSANVDVIKKYEMNRSFLSDLQLSIEQEQHYQVPKSGNRRVAEQQEDVYDDVRISQNFKNQRDQRDSVVTPEKSVWSRLGSGKMPRILSRQSSCNESTDGPANQSRPFQKLISKVENTLGKATKASGVTQN